jgi:hypothetical protein
LGVTAGSEEEERVRSGIPHRSGSAQASHDIEAQLERLAEEMGRLIDGGPHWEQESLRAYAVSLLRERVPSGESIEEDEDILAYSEAAADEPRDGTNSATLIGYGFLLLPASAVLLLVFPPVGGMLFVTGVMLMVCGLGWAMVSKFIPDSWAFRRRRSITS